MGIRWDFGAVYKDIRQAKGLTQEQVCGGELSRTTLAKIEANRAIPNFENMMFLLDQVNMSLEEFQYICSNYHLSKRQDIFYRFYNSAKAMGTKELEDVRQLCEQYLTVNHDIPIERLLDVIVVLINVRKHGFVEPTKELQLVTKKIWSYLEEQDEWYERDFQLLNAVLFSFPLETIKETTEKLLVSLEKYKDYRNITDIKYALLANLSSIFLYNNCLTDCERLTMMIEDLARETKRYDQLGFAQIRLGICRDDRDLIDKGLALLELTGEDKMLTNAREELDRLKK